MGTGVSLSTSHDGGRRYRLAWSHWELRFRSEVDAGTQFSRNCLLFCKVVSRVPHQHPILLGLRFHGDSGAAWAKTRIAKSSGRDSRHRPYREDHQKIRGRRTSWKKEITLGAWAMAFGLGVPHGVQTARLMLPISRFSRTAVEPCLGHARERSWGMRMLWCWRCKMEVPMLDEVEYAQVANYIARRCVGPRIFDEKSHSR
jgi:hypothetical protein